jgi:hypothetical protein
VQKIETSSEATLREAEEEGDRGAQSLEAWDKGLPKDGSSNRAAASPQESYRNGNQGTILVRQENQTHFRNSVELANKSESEDGDGNRDTHPEKKREATKRQRKARNAYRPDLPPIPFRLSNLVFEFGFKYEKAVSREAKKTFPPKAATYCGVLEASENQTYEWFFSGVYRLLVNAPSSKALPLG